MPSSISRRKFAVIAAGVSTSFIIALTGCNSSFVDETGDELAESVAETVTGPGEMREPVDVRVASLMGPTSIGIAGIMQKSEAGELADAYTFEIDASPDVLLPKVIKGEVDIAMIPSNAAALLYQKTEGALCTIDLNTLGVLYMVSGDTNIVSFDDIAGKTLYLHGKGATPDYVITYMLKQAGLTDKVTLEFHSEAAEVAALLAEDPMRIGILPEPFCTIAMSKNNAIDYVINITDAWEELMDDGSQLVMGVTVAQKSFVQAHPEAIIDFITAHKASVALANDDPSAVAQTVVDQGIIPSVEVAEIAIPKCNVVAIDGADMREGFEGYLKALMEIAPDSMGGALPDDDFYYGII